MKTTSYNPSQLEVEFANALTVLKDQIEQHLSGNKILHIEGKNQVDNPILTFRLKDEDGDEHEMVVKIIQRPDTP